MLKVDFKDRGFLACIALGFIVPVIVGVIDWISHALFHFSKPTTFNPAIVIPIMFLFGIQADKDIPEKSKMRPQINRTWGMVILCFITDIFLAITPVRLLTFGVTTFVMMSAITSLSNTIRLQKDKEPTY